MKGEERSGNRSEQWMWKMKIKDCVGDSEVRDGDTSGIKLESWIIKIIKMEWSNEHFEQKIR